LDLEHFRVQAAAREQVFVRAFFPDFPIVQCQDLVRDSNGRETVGDEKYHAILGETRKLLARIRIPRRARFFPFDRPRWLH
jgi:hypothetical protein